MYSTYYEIYRSDENIEDVSEMIPIYSGPENSYQGTGLIDGTYYYAVVAVNSTGESGISNVISVTVEIEDDTENIIPPVLNSVETLDGDRS